MLFSSMFEIYILQKSKIQRPINESRKLIKFPAGWDRYIRTFQFMKVIEIHYHYF